MSRGITTGFTPRSRSSGTRGSAPTPVGRLRSSLQHLLEQRDGKLARLARGLEPYDGGWRASAAYRTQTEAVLDDPIARLPHYPMVLHRGGWPDGS